MEKTQLKPLEKGRRSTGPQRDKSAKRLREPYAHVASIRNLTVQTGRSQADEATDGPQAEMVS